VSGNTAKVRGGGIFNDIGTATLVTGSQVTANAAGQVNGGGGVYENSGTVNVADPAIVTLNTAGGLPDNCRPAGAVENCLG
jgi:hypothetical protein